ncbi:MULTISPECIES: SDR family oxidoreductase [Streptomyces]|uniref:SDR family oxidoreductase n=1 Tax=Streptomyces TaxID=1883 RepID=UPI001D03F2B2|nr:MULTISPECIES: SDR family oxidoreductase [Streptomyces]
MTTQDGPLAGRIALVAGATRGAGRAMAVELGRAGATVYVTGRTTRSSVSEVGRATETIEETGELVTQAGGEGIAVPTDHLEAEQVRALVERIDREHGRLDVLINDVWGGEHLIDISGGKKMWEFGLEPGMRMLRLGVESHIITSHFALPLLVRNEGGLLVEVTDGTAESNADYRGSFYYDLTKYAPIRMAAGLGQELKGFGCAAVSVTPGFLRSEQMLESAFGVTEENWRDAIAKEPYFAISETPTYLGRGVAALAADPERARFNGRSLDSATLAREYGVTDVDGSRPDCWAFLKRALAGEEVDAADYR